MNTDNLHPLFWDIINKHSKVMEEEINKNDIVSFEPEEDITTYELAYILKNTFLRKKITGFKDVQKSVARHFKKIETNED